MKNFQEFQVIVMEFRKTVNFSVILWRHFFFVVYKYSIFFLLISFLLISFFQVPLIFLFAVVKQIS